MNKDEIPWVLFSKFLMSVENLRKTFSLKYTKPLKV